MQKKYKLLLIFIVVVALISVYFYIKPQIDRINKTGNKITISVLDSLDGQPINNATAKLEGLTVGIPEDSTPSPKFGEETTKDGVAIFYVPTNMLNVIFAFGVKVTAENYIGEYQTFDKGKHEFTIQLINKQKAVVNSEELAVEYAKKDEWVAYWLEKHPGFDSDDSENYRVSRESPFWNVKFVDSIDRNFHGLALKCSNFKIISRIECNITAKVNAVDGMVVELIPDNADTKWAD